MKLERVVARGLTGILRKCDDRIVGLGQCGLAQEQAWWEALDRLFHDPFGVAGFDLAFDQHLELG